MPRAALCPRKIEVRPAVFTQWALMLRPVLASIVRGSFGGKWRRGSAVLFGQQARAALGGDYQQEVDLITLFKDVAHEWVHMVTDPAQMRHAVDRAMRIALAERTVTCVRLETYAPVCGS